MILLTSHDAAKRIGFTPNALLWHCANGRIRFQRISNGSRVFRPCDVDAFRKWWLPHRQKTSVTVAREEALAGK